MKLYSWHAAVFLLAVGGACEADFLHRDCDDCDVNATCNDEDTCVCDPGFYGDGKTCDDADPDPVCECDEGATCANGVVHSGGPEDCDWCSPEAYHPCEHGCWTESAYGPIGGPDELCFEAHSHSVGDPCSSDDDCLPTEAHHTGNDLVTLFLECDEGAGACVEHPGPPLPADWLGPCDPAAIDPFLATAPSSQGWMDDASCSGGVCMVIGDPNGCDRAGCITPCEVDWDCAQGTRCSNEDAFGVGSEYRMLCMPWQPEESLSCHE